MTRLLIAPINGSRAKPIVWDPANIINESPSPSLRFINIGIEKQNVAICISVAINVIITIHLRLFYWNATIIGWIVPHLFRVD